MNRYLGRKISLTTKSEIRYEGICYAVDTKESTIALAKVRSFGTEDRPTEHPVAPEEEVYSSIRISVSDIMQLHVIEPAKASKTPLCASNIKDLHMCEPPKTPQTLKSGLPNDPAVVQYSASVPLSSNSFNQSGNSLGLIGALPSYQTYSQSNLQRIPQSFATRSSQTYGSIPSTTTPSLNSSDSAPCTTTSSLGFVASAPSTTTSTLGLVASAPPTTTSTLGLVASAPPTITSILGLVASAPPTTAPSSGSVASTACTTAPSPGSVASAACTTAPSPGSVASAPHTTTSSPGSVASAPPITTATLGFVAPAPPSTAPSPGSVASAARTTAPSPGSVASASPITTSTLGFVAPAPPTTAPSLGFMPGSGQPIVICINNPYYKAPSIFQYSGSIPSTTTPSLNSSDSAPCTTTSSRGFVASAPSTTTSTLGLVASAPPTTTSTIGLVASAPPTTTSTLGLVASAPSTTASTLGLVASAPPTTTSTLGLVSSAPPTTAPSPRSVASAPRTTTSSPGSVVSAPPTTAPRPGSVASAPLTTAPSPGSVASSPRTTTSSPASVAPAPPTTAPIMVIMPGSGQPIRIDTHDPYYKAPSIYQSSGSIPITIVVSYSGVSAPSTTLSSLRFASSAPCTTTSRPGSVASAPLTTTSRPGSVASAPLTTTSRPGSVASAALTTTSSPGSVASAPPITTSTLGFVAPVPPTTAPSLSFDVPPTTMSSLGFMPVSGQPIRIGTHDPNYKAPSIYQYSGLSGVNPKFDPLGSNTSTINGGPRNIEIERQIQKLMADARIHSEVVTNSPLGTAQLFNPLIPFANSSSIPPTIMPSLISGVSAARATAPSPGSVASVPRTTTSSPGSVASAPLTTTSSPGSVVSAPPITTSTLGFVAPAPAPPTTMSSLGFMPGPGQPIGIGTHDPYYKAPSIYQYSGLNGVNPKYYPPLGSNTSMINGPHSDITNTMRQRHKLLNSQKGVNSVDIKVFGELSLSNSCPTTYTWTVNALPRRTDFYGIKSPEICHGTGNWYLCLYPNGLPENNRPWYGVNQVDEYMPLGDMILAFVTVFPALYIYDDWKINMRLPDKTLLKSFCIKRTSARGNPPRCRYFVLPFEVVRQVRYSVDQCSLIFEMISETGTEPVAEASSPAALMSGIDRLAQDLKDMLASGDASNVTVLVKGRKDFRVHRDILRARAPVFASMFKYQMSENTTDIINVDDCEPDTFQRFLHYVYTGRVEDLSPRNAHDLYEVAIKYQMDSLKLDCLEYMKHSLSVESICDTLVLACRHEEKELTELAMEFFKSNISEVIATVKWQNFLCENPIHANELLINAHRQSKLHTYF